MILHNKKLHTKSLFSDEIICQIFRVNQDAMQVEAKRKIVEEIITVLEDVDKMAVLIGGLPDSFETIVTILENDPKSSYATCKESILNHAHKLVQENAESGERLNAATTVVENHPRDLRMSTNIRTETECLRTSKCRLSREHLPEHCHVSF